MFCTKVSGSDGTYRGAEFWRADHFGSGNYDDVNKETKYQPVQTKRRRT